MNRVCQQGEDGREERLPRVGACEAHLLKCRCLLAASFLVQGETIWSVGEWNEDWL